MRRRGASRACEQAVLQLEVAVDDEGPLGVQVSHATREAPLEAPLERLAAAVHHLPPPQPHLAPNLDRANPYVIVQWLCSFKLEMIYTELLEQRSLSIDREMI